MTGQEEIKKWILEHPEEAKKIFADFADWIAKLPLGWIDFLTELSKWILGLYENALQEDKTGELRRFLEEAGFWVTEEGRIYSRPTRGMKGE